MTFPLPKLAPGQLKTRVTAKKEFKMVNPSINMNWSCTSRCFRNLLPPYIFKAVKLRHIDKSGISLNDLASSSHSALLEESYFLGAEFYSKFGKAGQGTKFPQTVAVQRAVEIHRLDADRNFHSQVHWYPSPTSMEASKVWILTHYIPCF